MAKKRCQVCDGPIANGRCRYCGMPYRKDEVLYHLNESRKDHYRHASNQARATMRQQMVPLGDKKPAQNKPATKAEINAHQQQVRQDAMQRMTNTRVPVNNRSTSTVSAGQKKSVTAQNRTYTTTNNKKVEKKKPAAGKIIALLILLWGLLPSVIGLIKENFQDIGFMSNSRETYQKIDEDFYLKAFLQEGDMVMVSEKGDGLRPGTYVIYIEEGHASVLVGNAEDHEYYYLGAGDNIAEVIVEAGDAIAVEETDESYRYVDVYHDQEND